MPIRHILTHPHNSAALEEAVADLHASIRYDALEREAERRVETRRLVDAGVQVRQVAYLVPLGERARDCMVLLGREELGVEVFQGGGVGEEVLPYAAQDDAGGVGAGDYVGVGPCCCDPVWRIRIGTLRWLAWR